MENKQFVRYAPGLLLASAAAICALVIGSIPALAEWGFGVLTVAIILGMLAGNTFYPKISNHCAGGVAFAKTYFLRLGIILYGFRLSAAQLQQVGWTGLLVNVLMIASTFMLAYFLGTKWLKLDRHTAALIGAGSGICGAAAVVAAESAIRAGTQKAVVAVSTVVMYGTIAIFLYPLIYRFAPHGLTDSQFGVYVGSTVHEIAQVAAIGANLGGPVAALAVTAKMLRVILLAPFLLVLGLMFPPQDTTAAEASGGIWRTVYRAVPWFALWFLAAVGFNSLNLLPQTLTGFLVSADNFILAVAMAALGIETRFATLRQAGIRPVVLAAVLMVWLVCGGWLLQRLWA